MVHSYPGIQAKRLVTSRIVLKVLFIRNESWVLCMYLYIKCTACACTAWRVSTMCILVLRTSPSPSFDSNRHFVKVSHRKCEIILDSELERSGGLFLSRQRSDGLTRFLFFGPQSAIR